MDITNLRTKQGKTIVLHHLHEFYVVHTSQPFSSCQGYEMTCFVVV